MTKEELKTLKEIREELLKSMPHIPHEAWTIATRTITEIVEPKLKAEAIKWIKSLNKLNKDNYEKPRGYEINDFHGLKDVEIDWEESSEIYGMIKILKHFFNITEEDLK